MADGICDACGMWVVQCGCRGNVNLPKQIKQVVIEKDNTKKLSNQEIINIINKRSIKDKEFIINNLK